MENKVDKKEIKSILNHMAMVTQRPLDEEGNLDVAAFNKLASVTLFKEQLRAAGIRKNTDLIDAGFIGAGLVLNFN